MHPALYLAGEYPNEYAEYHKYYGRYRKASKSLGRAIQQIDAKEHFIAPIMEFLLRITLALILLFDPFEKFSTHIAILGLELIVTSIRFSKNFFPAWED